MFCFCFICVYIVWLSLSFLALWADSFHQIRTNWRPFHFQIFSHSCHLFLISITGRSPWFCLLTYLFREGSFLYGSVYLLRSPYIFMFTYLLLLLSVLSVQTSYLLARSAFVFILRLPQIDVHSHIYICMYFI